MTVFTSESYGHAYSSLMCLRSHCPLGCRKINALVLQTLHLPTHQHVLPVFPSPRSVLPLVSHLFLASQELCEGVSVPEAMLGTWYKCPKSMLSRFGQRQGIDDHINQLQELIPYVTALCGQASLCLPKGGYGL